MYTTGYAREHHIGLLILLLTSTCLAADGRQYKAKDRQSSASSEQGSEEGQGAFSAEFGEFFPDGSPKESGESFGFTEDFNPDFIPYSETRNATKYVNPAETYHAVRDMPGHGRDHSRSYKEEHSGSRKYEPTNRKDYKKDYRKHSSHPKDDSYPKEDGYRKEEGYSKDDGYHKQDSYRKADSYRKDESYRSKDEPEYRSRDSSYRREGKSSRPSYNRREDSPYSKEDEPPSPSYKSHGSESRYRKDGSPRSSDGSHGRHGSHGSHGPSSHGSRGSHGSHGSHGSYGSQGSHGSHSSSHRSSAKEKSESPDSGYDKKKPIQNLYDDWSPENDKPSYRESDRSEPEPDSDYEEPNYRESEEAPNSSAYSDKEQRKSLPTSMRPGPPYYSPPVRRPEPRTHTTSFGVRHELPPPPTPQTYYAPSSSQRKSENSREFHHRKGEPAPSKPQREWSEFRPSPPDPLQNSRARSRSDDHSHIEYSSPVPKKEKAITTTPRPINRHNCVKMKKTSSPDANNGKYVKKMTTCYVCVDEKTGTNYEECSYESDSKTRPFVKTTGEEQSRRSDVSHRDKRDVSKVAPDTVQPTESTDRQKREKEYYESSKEAEEGGEGYKFNPESEEEPEKDEASGETSDSSSENCYKKKKGEMSCVVCESPNKKGSYEQCSYASEPNKNKYEHSVEKVYGSPRLPESALKFNKKGYDASKDEEYDSSVELPSKSDYASSEFPSSGESGIPSAKKSNKANRKQFGGGSDSFGFESFGDGFGSLFSDISEEGFDFDSIPEPAENEGQFSTKDEIFNFKPEEIGDIDLTKNIDNFGQKNRSHCKKVMKNKMTCYQCVTSKGTKNEECMYLAAAEPKSKHLSFSQVEEYRFDPENSTAQPSVDYAAYNFGKRKNKKYHPDLTDMKFFNKLKEKATLQASRWPRSPDNGTSGNETKSRNATGKDDQLVSASETNPNQTEADEEGEESEDEEEEEEESEEEEEEGGSHEQYNAVPTEPPELDLKEAEKGEFHSETESAWDPKLGISLPRYMLERSEHEAIFDEVLASG